MDGGKKPVEPHAKIGNLFHEHFIFALDLGPQIDLHRVDQLISKPRVIGKNSGGGHPRFHYLDSPVDAFQAEGGKGHGLFKERVQKGSVRTDFIGCRRKKKSPPRLETSGTTSGRHLEAKRKAKERKKCEAKERQKEDNRTQPYAEPDTSIFEKLNQTRAQGRM
jgi:hypothetical protein